MHLDLVPLLIADSHGHVLTTAPKTAQDSWAKRAASPVASCSLLNGMERGAPSESSTRGSCGLSSPSSPSSPSRRGPASSYTRLNDWKRKRQTCERVLGPR